MRIALWTAVGAAILISCKAIGPVAVEGSRAYDCLGADYDRYTYDERAPIPDACPAGIAIGPVQTTDDGSALEGVVLQVSIVHPSPADVRLWLAYDADKDGKTDARVPLELYKARSERCAGRDPFACPSTLDGVYYFRDDTTRVDGPSLSLFDGLRSGGRFYLGAADTLRDDVGAVRSWSVYVRKPKSALAAFRQEMRSGNCGTPSLAHLRNRSGTAAPTRGVAGPASRQRKNPAPQFPEPSPSVSTMIPHRRLSLGRRARGPRAHRAPGKRDAS